MNLGQQLALTRPWWMWQAPEIQYALAKVKLEHWLGVVRRALDANKSAGRSPCSLKELPSDLYLSRDPRNVERVTQGKYGLTDQYLLGLASCLRIPLSEFFPSVRDWIAKATVILCPSADPVEAVGYAAYRLQSAPTVVPPNRPLDDSAIRVVLTQLAGSWKSNGEMQEAILRVADLLGKVLVLSQGVES